MVLTSGRKPGRPAHPSRIEGSRNAFPSSGGVEAARPRVPEVSVSHEEKERAAEEEEAIILRQLRKNPKSEAFAARMWQRLYKDYPRTRAGRRARERYRDLLGEDIPDFGAAGGGAPEVAARLSSPKSGAGTDASEAFEKARDASRLAESRGEYHAARAALRRFIEAHGSSRLASRAAELLDALDGRIHASLTRLYERAQNLSRRGLYAEAENLLRELMDKDPLGADAGRAKELLERNRGSARKVHEDAVARAKPYFEAYEFNEAARVLRDAARRLPGTEWEAKLVRAAESAETCRGAIARLGEKLKSAADPPVLERREKGGRRTKLAVLAANPAGLRVGEGGVQRRIAWSELTKDELFRVFESFPMTAEDHLGLGALLLSRGERGLARQELDKARRDPGLRARALDLLEQVDESIKARRFDFSRFEEASAWELEGNWGVQRGRFVHLDSGVGVARLREPGYRAAGLDLAFDVTFLDSEGTLEAGLSEAEGSYVRFTLGSEGYEVSAKAGGASSEARKAWSMRRAATYSIACLVIGDSVAVSVDGRPMKGLTMKGLGEVLGQLTFRAQGGRLDLDNIAVRQAE
jgi:hypothetical protein